ncbi:hypothetical protein JTB14_019229 [Gonioctena quinquepunctata]|nr:hypothetical protein JTB14_019229 [Gonioctena quinquepunctata]
MKYILARKKGQKLKLEIFRLEHLEWKGDSSSLDNNATEKSSSRSLRGNSEKSQVRRHRRSRSDDLFRRKLRFDEGSNSPRNSIISNIPEDRLEELPKKNKKSSKRIMQTAETVLLENNIRNMKVSDVKQPKKYTTRTSCAGTLIIPEESFCNAQRRRQQRPDDSERPAGAPPTAGEREERQSYARSTSSRSLSRSIGEDSTKETERRRRRRRLPESEKRLLKQVSDPAVFRRFEDCDASNRSKATAVPEENIAQKKRSSHVHRQSTPSNYLFYSHSDVFPFERILNIVDESQKLDENHNNNRILSTSINSSGSRQNSGAITEKLNRKKRRKVRRRKSDGSTSSGTKDAGDSRKGKESFIRVCGFARYFLEFFSDFLSTGRKVKAFRKWISSKVWGSVIEFREIQDAGI